MAKYKVFQHSKCRKFVELKETENGYKGICKECNKEVKIKIDKKVK